MENQRWNTRYNQLVLFNEENGHCRVPGKYPKLRIWVKEQRQLYKKNKLLSDRIELLKNIGFEWELRKVEFVGWNERLEELKEYKDKNGDCNVSTLDENNEKLGNWVMHQRELYKNGKLSQDRIKLLNKIEFEWVLQKQVSWNESYGQLVQFNNEHGHCDVPQGYIGNTKMANWVKKQPQLYKKGKLSSEQIESMNGIGFKWNPEEDRWNEMFEQLVQFNEEHGHCNVSTKDKDNKQLAYWGNTQRKAKKKKGKGNISAEQIKLLEGIGFKWVLPRGPRPAVVEVSDVEDSVSDGEEEDSSPTYLESEDEDGKTTTATRRRSPRLSKSTKLSSGYTLRSRRSKEEKIEEAEEDSTLDDDEDAKDEDDEDERGGDGSSFIVDEDDNNDQHRNGLAASVVSMQDKLKEVRLAHSKDITQLKETHEKSMDDLKTSHEKEMALKEELVKDTEAKLEVVKGVCEKKDHLIEQMKALQSESNKKQCILEKQIEQVSLMHDAYKISSVTKIEHAKAEVSALKLQESKLRKELEAARAKLPKSKSFKRKGAPGSLGTDMAADHEVLYTHDQVVSSKKPRRSPRREEESTQFVTTRREVRGPTEFVRMPREVYEPYLVRPQDL